MCIFRIIALFRLRATQITFSPEGEFALTRYDDVRKQVERCKWLKRINDGDEPMLQDDLLPNQERRIFQIRVVPSNELNATDDLTEEKSGPRV